MLTKDATLPFLGNKIQEIKMAMFKAETNNELQLPNNIITTIKTDSDGNIWFFTSCNGVYTQYTGTNFFAYLEYHQKGQNCRLRINGLGAIVEGDSGIDNAATGINTKNNTNTVLIKFKILHAEYYQHQPSVKLSPMSKIKNFLSDIFNPHLHRIYNFSRLS